VSISSSAGCTATQQVCRPPVSPLEQLHCRIMLTKRDVYLTFYDFSWFRNDIFPTATTSAVRQDRLVRGPHSLCGHCTDIITFPHCTFSTPSEYPNGTPPLSAGRTATQQVCRPPVTLLQQLDCRIMLLSMMRTLLSTTSPNL
jgi:hypothetical protein